ncbi:DNA polymerase zeta [Quaeritorhiza haematococci]|nr:DNA polymerase zeta [Quaeritorhiza haematococci]
MLQELNVDFSDCVPQQSADDEDGVMTAFQAVEAIHPQPQSYIKFFRTFGLVPEDNTIQPETDDLGNASQGFMEDPFSQLSQQYMSCRAEVDVLVDSDIISQHYGDKATQEDEEIVDILEWMAQGGHEEGGNMDIEQGRPIEDSLFPASDGMSEENVSQIVFEDQQQFSLEGNSEDGHDAVSNVPFDIIPDDPSSSQLSENYHPEDIDEAASDGADNDLDIMNRDNEDIADEADAHPRAIVDSLTSSSPFLMQDPSDMSDPISQEEPFDGYSTDDDNSKSPIEPLSIQLPSSSPRIPPRPSDLQQSIRKRKRRQWLLTEPLQRFGRELFSATSRHERDKSQPAAKHASLQDDDIDDFDDDHHPAPENDEGEGEGVSDDDMGPRRIPQVDGADDTTPRERKRKRSTGSPGEDPRKAQTPSASQRIPSLLETDASFAQDQSNVQQEKTIVPETPANKRERITSARPPLPPESAPLPPPTIRQKTIKPISTAVTPLPIASMLTTESIMSSPNGDMVTSPPVSYFTKSILDMWSPPARSTSHSAFSSNRPAPHSPTAIKRISNISPGSSTSVNLDSELKGTSAIENLRPTSDAIARAPPRQTDEVQTCCTDSIQDSEHHESTQPQTMSTVIPPGVNSGHTPYVLTMEEERLAAVTSTSQTSDLEKHHADDAQDFSGDQADVSLSSRLGDPVKKALNRIDRNRPTHEHPASKIQSEIRPEMRPPEARDSLVGPSDENTVKKQVTIPEERALSPTMEDDTHSDSQMLEGNVDDEKRDEERVCDDADQMLSQSSDEEIDVDDVHSSACEDGLKGFPQRKDGSLKKGVELEELSEGKHERAVADEENDNVLDPTPYVLQNDSSQTPPSPPPRKVDKGKQRASVWPPVEDGEEGFYQPNSAPSHKGQSASPSPPSQPRAKGVRRADIWPPVHGGVGPPPSPVYPKSIRASHIYCFDKPPPNAQSLQDSLYDQGLHDVVYREPYFSDPQDIPGRTRLFAGREFRFPSDDLQSLKEFEPALARPESESHEDMSESKLLDEAADRSMKISDDAVPTQAKSRLWTPAAIPPSRLQINKWLKDNGPSLRKSSQGKTTDTVSQIARPTPQNKYGFKYTQIKSANLHNEKQYLHLLSLEVHDDEMRHHTNGSREGYYVGIIIVEDEVADLSKTGICGYVVEPVPDEKALLETVREKVIEFDPDILVGYEINDASWGYLVQRAAVLCDIDFCGELARVKSDAKTKFGKEQNPWGFRKQSTLQTTGRIFLNVWRLMKSELNLTSYTLENTAYHVLHTRIPKFNHKSLTEWYGAGALKRWRTIKYYIERVQYNLDLLDDTDFISRTSEFARVFGVDFYSVIIRGSQFKVESIMARIARPENFIMISPSRKQVAAMRAAECLPLVMEPQSRFYNSPLLVLDFQSLYPSIMIAYNYCFSTCLGRVQSIGKPHKFGVLDDYEVPTSIVEKFKDQLNVSPNGLAFLKHNVREGVLRRMLTEILDTRIMVKQSMKSYKKDKGLLRILEARQLGLKYIANVTYGYTGASFSGRMPCVDIADAIVQTGRVTLEKAIDLIHTTKKWRAQVVYGDTDSLFVYLPGQSRERAFQIGQEIVDTVTSLNPHPVKLKFEKVYHPCVLLAKKRYVGFKYESREDKEPVFEAKGIETVRRDGCAAVQKMMENSLKSQDMSELKQYLYAEWAKILTGRVSIQDFIIAKEVKLGTYSDRGTLPPGAMISLQKMQQDPRAEPHYGQRVPYVVVHGGPNDRVIDQVVPPEELLHSRNLRLHGTYYITKQIIPALSRIFNLIGIDLETWFHEMPKIQRAMRFTSSQQQQPLLGNEPGKRKFTTIDQFYAIRHCLVCHEDSVKALPPSTIHRAKIRAADTCVSFLFVPRQCHGRRRGVRVA